MGALSTPKVEEGILTRLEIISKAATFKSLTATSDRSEPIITCLLDEETVSILSERGLNRDLRGDGITTFSIADLEGYWNFRTDKDKMEITLLVDFYVEERKRGVVFFPITSDAHVWGGKYKPSQFQMFKLLAEIHPEAPAVVHELARSNGSLIVTWTELGLGGIRQLPSLFAEFYGDNKFIRQLANSDMSPFNPVPYPSESWEQALNDKSFVTEPSQPEIMEGWRKQLEEFCRNLSIP